MKSSKWTSNIPKDELKDLEASIIAAIPAFKRLKKLLEDRRSSAEVERLSKNTYESPAWACYQADANGYTRAINEIIKLIEVE